MPAGGRGILARAATPVLPAVLALLLGAWAALVLQPFRDEQATILFARLTPSELLRATDHVDRVYLPYYALAHLQLLVDDHVAWFRLPSVLAVAGVVLLAGRLADRWWGRPAGVVTGLALALNPVVLRTAADARPYALALLLVTAATVVLAGAVGGRARWTRWALYAVLAAGAAALQLFSVLGLLAHLVLVLRRRDRATLTRFTLAGLLPLGVAAVLVVVTRTQRAQISWIPDVDLRGAVAIAATQTALPTAVLLLVVLAAAGTALALRSGRTATATALVLLAGAPAMLLAASALLVPTYYGRYLVAVPLGAALLVGTLAGRRRTPVHPRSAVRAATVLAPVLAGLGLLLVARTATVDLLPSLLGHEAPRVVSPAALVGPGSEIVLAQDYTDGGAVAGLAATLDDDGLYRQVLDELPDGDPPLTYRVVTSTSPWTTTTATSDHPAPSVVLLGITKAAGLPAGYDRLVALGCASNGSVTVLGDYSALALTCPARPAGP